MGRRGVEAAREEARPASSSGKTMALRQRVQPTDAPPPGIVELCEQLDATAPSTRYALTKTTIEALRDDTKRPRAPWYTKLLVWRVVRDLFLPEGYPASVAPGYGAYQAWDVVQGLSSYVRGNLAYKATLEGLGVGDVEASAMAGAVAKIARDASSMVAGLALAYGCSRDFGRRVRQWRLAADVANDVGMTVQMLAPIVRGGAYFVPLACVAACCQCACGVIAGATKASISAHFARGNFAELVSKEGSQETFVNILGLLGGYACLTRLNASATAVWGSFALLTALHVVANVKAVRTVTLTTLNEPRFALCYDAFVASTSLAPAAVGAAEPLLPPLFKSRWTLGAKVADAAPRDLAAAIAKASPDDAFLLVGDLVYLAPAATDGDVLEARFCVARARDGVGVDAAKADFGRFARALDAAGWDTTAQLLDVDPARLDWGPSFNRI